MVKLSLVKELKRCRLTYFEGPHTNNLAALNHIVLSLFGFRPHNYFGGVSFSQYHSSLLETLFSHLLSLSSSNQLTIRKTLPLLFTSVSTAFLSSSSSTTMDKHVEPEQTADADKGDTLVLEKVSVISTMGDSLLMAHLRKMLGRSLSRPCSRPSRQSSKNRSGWNLPTELLYCPCSMHIMKRFGIRPSLD